MILTAGNVLLIGSVIIFTSIVISSKVSSRVGVPMLLLFLLVGMLFGTDGLGVEFDNIKVAQTVGMIALSIILFSGGLGTKVSEIKPVLWQGAALSTLGVVLMTFITGTFIWLILLPFKGNMSVAMDYPVCLLLAAVMSSTDSASVFNILRTQNIGLRKNLRPLLELESGSNDPMANMLTIILIQICQGGDGVTGWSVAGTFLTQFTVGAICGVIFGYAFVWLVNKINLSNPSLYPIAMLSIIFFSFSITDLLHGNGYLAVYLTGIIMGNRPLVKKRECSKFLEGVTWLCQIVMFLTLGLLVVPHELLDVALLGTLIGIFMIFLGRPIAVLLTLLPFRQPSFKAKIFASWVGLRGATPILFATYPVVAGLEGSRMIFNIVFYITILSLILQGTTLTRIAQKLDLLGAAPQSGNAFGVELPEEIDSRLWDQTVTEEMLAHGCRLKDMNIPKGVLVIMIKRGSDYLVPNGTLELQKDDQLLLIAQSNLSEEYKLQD